MSKLSKTLFGHLQNVLIKNVYCWAQFIFKVRTFFLFEKFLVLDTNLLFVYPNYKVGSLKRG